MKALLAAALIVVPSLAPVTFVSATPQPHASSVIIDSVIATVDETPITLQDLRKRLNPPRSLTLEEAANDTEARALLERMILEQAILAEAEMRKMNVSNADVERYLDEIAKRNNLTRAGLEKAFADEKRDLNAYKAQVKIDILQSRLTSAYLQGSNAIGQEEVDAYIAEHPELIQQGSRVKIRRIFVSQLDKAKSIEERLKSGDDFAKVAKESSEGPEAAEGGLLGVLVEKDLSPELFDAILTLSPGSVSEPLSTDGGYQIIKLEERVTDDGEVSQQITEDVKRRLQEQKLESKMQSFFTTELFKHHTVDKKI